MKRIVLALICMLLPSLAGAQPVKCVDEKGRTRYVDKAMVAQEKCKQVNTTQNVVPAGKRRDAPGFYGEPGAPPPSTCVPSPGMTYEEYCLGKPKPTK